MLILGVILATAYVVSPKIEENIKETTTATVYLSPVSVVGPPPNVGETFTLDINVDNVTDLYAWSIGMEWNPTVLECINFTYNDTFITGLEVPGNINNIVGEVYPPYALASTTGGVTGSGTLAEVKFMAVAYGTTSISFTLLDLMNSSEVSIPFSVVNGSFTLPYGPTAVKTHEPSSIIYTESPVTFNASASESGFNGSAEVKIASYTWDFGDGNTPMVSDPIIEHNYTTANNYTVTLTVTCQYDAVLAAKDLLSDTTSQNITVTRAPDTTSPTISNVAQNPTKTEVDANENVTVTATVTDIGWGVQTVLLRYSTDNSTFTNVTMTLSSGNNYTAQIPGQAADTYVSYKIFANDSAGNFDETTLSWYRVKQPTQLPWLWIAIGASLVVIIILVAVYLMRRKHA